MKTVFAVLAVISVAQALSIPSGFGQLGQLGQLQELGQNLVNAARKSFREFASMTKAQRLEHVKTNCPSVQLDNDTIIQNIEQHLKNANLSSALKGFEEGFTCMTSYSPDQFKQFFLTVRPNQGARDRVEAGETSSSRQKRQTTTVPASVDWRTSGYVTPVQDQGQCGSCWTFSANGAMEGAIYARTKKLPNLSEQNLVDCVNASSGCNGGWMTDAYDYSNVNGGVDSDASYPYVAKQNPTCGYKAVSNAGKVISYKYTAQNNETDLKNKLATVGPIAAAIDATYIQSYTGGIITCPKFAAVNHGILIVGYGTNATSGQDFWIVKNSWGPNWGEQGYMRIIRNQGVNLGCGLASYANYPIA